MQLPALFVPRVPGRLAAGGGRRAAGAGGVGREGLAAEAGRVGAWPGALGGGLVEGGRTSCTHTPRDTLWEKNGWRDGRAVKKKGKPGDEKLLLVQMVRGQTVGQEEPQAEPPGRFPVAFLETGTFLKCV